MMNINHMYRTDEHTVRGWSKCQEMQVSAIIRISDNLNFELKHHSIKPHR
jgi:hypothetical protein